MSHCNCRRNNRRGPLLGLAILIIAAALAPPPAAAQGWKPTKNVEIVSTAGAGGSADRGARVLQKFISAMPGIPSVTVSNRVGGGGIVAWTFMSQHPNDPHYLATLSPGLLTNQIVGTSPLSYRDFTPLNILMREYVVVSVRAESPLTSAKEIIARLTRDPGSVVFGYGTAPGNQNHVVIGMLAKSAGVDPKQVKTVVFNSGNAAATAMLGGHVDVLVGTPGTVLPHITGGRARALGSSAPERQPGAYAATPTLRESGINAVYYSWRGFLAPRGITPEQIAYWDQAFAKVTQTDDWKQDLQSNAWTEDYRGPAETRKHLDAEYELLKTILVELGVVGSK
jgi:putative tricarboxylic transport membrane protein